jgi:GH24 family phage-related lysozyme (muramidase)
VLSEARASALLQQDIDQKYGAHVAGRVHRDLTPHQFNRMVSLCFNIGTGGFDKSSVLALANAGATDSKLTVSAFGLWNKVASPRTRIKEISKGLTIRRAREAALYLQA